MPEHEETVELPAAPAAVWAALARPEDWFVGYRQTRARSPEYPSPGSRNDHVYHTRVDEQVDVAVVSSMPEELLEEEHEGRTFRRRIRYRLEPAGAGTRLTVTDDISFKGLARLAAPFAFEDARGRWGRSLERLRGML
jgi:uncharacterized protein YndB with AHSA1/START domain